ncbi:hypothetical protein ARTHRO9V_10102 [Arthrobacter sp. 9V]|nr:hypothetical protein ARTHRO9V_10102 [Arthrobacter sp. 9V]
MHGRLAATAAGVRTTWPIDTDKFVTAMLLLLVLLICRSTARETPGASSPLTDPETAKVRLTSRTCNCPGAALETNVPLVALTVKSVFVAGVVVAVAMVNVTCAVEPEVRLTDDGDWLAVAPAGKPATVKVTGPTNPAVDVADTVNVADCPWSTVRLEGDSTAEIPAGTLAALTWLPWALLCPLLAARVARVAMGIIATTMASSSARKGGRTR